MLKSQRLLIIAKYVPKIFAKVIFRFCNVAVICSSIRENIHKINFLTRNIILKKFFISK